ncbi:MAG TPA: hypothetical protein GXZ20_09370 [Halanaerobiaceae bacterium]|mgnify:CR=1 FL=1|jgi:hypothetical protein|nr:hypothetical protein [Bacillota bacterium]HHU93325.1 hypothetical protein [Halanaerobiaceae bacterium]HOA40945.1 hypothetical protein [Halanaerobiales bacterium]HPZ62764.1 hypothetical protein [Halanaerobiales bacterium]HQD04328.1 hypothetical protein [Halanaerobiales bacterium]
MNKTLQNFITGFLLTLLLTVSGLVLMDGRAAAEDWFLEELYEIELDGVERLYFDIEGAEIFFEEDLENIYISDELEFDIRGGRIRVYTPKKRIFNFFGNRNHKIVLGTKNKFSLINIDAGGLALSGVLHVDDIRINAGGIDIDGEYYCKEMTINGAGIDIYGLLRGEQLEINGAGIDIELDVIGLEKISINGAGLDIYLKYLDGWTGTRHISANAVGGDIVILVPEDNKLEEDGQLEIDKGGFIDVRVRYY